MDDKGILVLGGTGLLGPLLCEALLRRYKKVFVFNRGNNLHRLVSGVVHIKGDRQNYDDLVKLKDIKVDFVIDTLGWFSETLSDILELFKGRIKHYIFFSSIAVYPDNINRLQTEEEKALGTNAVWDTISREKSICESICAKMSEQGLPCAILRLSHLYGLKLRPSRENTLIKMLQMRNEIRVPDDGKARLQFVHYEDVIAVCMDIIENSIKYRDYLYYNVSSQKAFTIAEWIEKCAAWSGLSPKLIFSSYEKSLYRTFLYLPGNVVVHSGRIESIFGRRLRSPDNDEFSLLPPVQ